MTDIELSKKAAVNAIIFMQYKPYPGGHEEKLLNYYANEDDNVTEGESNVIKEVPKRRIVISCVSTKRCRSAVRNEIISSCKEFLSQRLDEDQTSFIDRMNKFINGKSATEIIQSVRIDVENLFGEYLVSSLTDDVISLYAAEKLPPPV